MPDRKGPDSRSGRRKFAPTSAYRRGTASAVQAKPANAAFENRSWQEPPANPIPLACSGPRIEAGTATRLDTPTLAERRKTTFHAAPPYRTNPTAAPKPKCFQAATFDPDLRTPGRREGAPTSFEATATRELPQCKRGIGARGRVCPRNQTRPKALRLPRTRVPQMPQPSSTRWALPQAGPQRKELSGRPKQREHRQLPAQQNPEPSATAKPLPKRPARSDAPARREPRPSPEQPEQPVRPEPPVRLTPQTQPEHPVC